MSHTRHIKLLAETDNTVDTGFQQGVIAAGFVHALNLPAAILQKSRDNA